MSPSTTASGPGLIFVHSRITSPDLSQQVFEKWYDEVHIPDVLASGVVSSATRFRCLDPEHEYPWLVIYKLPDLAAYQSEAFKKIPLTHEMLPGDGNVHKVVDFSHRWYGYLNQLGGEGLSEEYEKYLVSGAMEPSTPAGHDDLDAWYKEEHSEQATTQPGWKRSTRWKLSEAIPPPMQKTDAPTWLALHEWDKPLGQKVAPFDPTTEWTMRVMKECKKVEALNFEKVFSMLKK